MTRTRMLLLGVCPPLVPAVPAASAVAKNDKDKGPKTHKSEPPPEQQSPLPNVTGCDSIDASACMLPFPNDLYTKADSTTATGRRVDFSRAARPRNGAGKPMDPSDQNRADGFSPGSEVI